MLFAFLEIMRSIWQSILHVTTFLQLQSTADIKVNTVKTEKAIDKLKNNELKVLFTVDMFNEGVDIPSIDSVLFLRPTESPTIFLQQLGRGLRIAENKEYLTVLDFIGNYKEENQYHVGALPAHDLSNQLYFQVLRRQISLKSSLQIKK